MGVPTVSMGHVLPNDRAIATQVPYSNPDAQIASVTRSTAQASGWIWDIGLQSRRGVGYVTALHTLVKMRRSAVCSTTSNTRTTMLIWVN